MSIAAGLLMPLVSTLELAAMAPASLKKICSSGGEARSLANSTASAAFGEDLLTP
jgi:hypothetical protein